MMKGMDMSKTEEIYFKLHDQILSGKLEPGERLPTEPEMAERLHVARKTLRGALSRLEKDGLLNRIPRVGTYVRSRNEPENPRILVVMSDFPGKPAYTPVWFLLPAVLEYCHSLELECDRVDIRMVRKIVPEQHNYIGLILADACYDFLDSELEDCRRLKLPMVTLNCFERTVRELKLPSVLPSRRQAWFDGLTHLLRRGHRKIGCIFISSWQSIRDRMEFTEQELRQYLLSHHAEDPKKYWIFAESEDSAELHTELIRMLKQPDRPTALYCWNDYVASRVYDCAAELNLRIPEDLAVMGFSGCLHGTLLSPALSTVDFCYREEAILAVKLLLEHKSWSGRKTPPVLYSPHEIRALTSTASYCLTEQLRH